MINAAINATERQAVANKSEKQIRLKFQKSRRLCAHKEYADWRHKSNYHSAVIGRGGGGKGRDREPGAGS